MFKLSKNILFLSVLFSFLALLMEAYPAYASMQPEDEEDIDTTKIYKANFKIKADPEVTTGELPIQEGIRLRNPSNIESKIEYDPINREYRFNNSMGNMKYRYPWSMNPEEYRKFELNKSIRETWRQQAAENSGVGPRGLRTSFQIGGETFDKIFGGNTINIVPKGQAELIFGVNIQTTKNPNIPEKLRTVPSFKFDERIQMNVEGSIGERVKLGISYNTDATFEFENKTNLSYTGDEDEIIKKIELGDVSLPLSGSLISGSQSLFGIKTEMQFGKLFVNTVLSQQRGQSQSIEVQGGAQVTEFEVMADEYEANKHFFLSQHFANNYDTALFYLPLIRSGISITRLDVWITNKTSNFQENRNILALADLAENNNIYLVSPELVTANNVSVPTNNANNLYSNIKDKVREYSQITQNLSGFTEGLDYEKIESARKLTEREYNFNPQLGFLSLNTSQNNDEIIAVAYEFIYQGKTYKVGEFPSDKPGKETLILKLIKGTNLSPRNPKAWNLMMKNVYSLNAFQVSKEDFELNIMYRYDKKGIDVAYIPDPNEELKDLRLIELMNLDNANSQLEPYPDGVFDYIEDITILSNNGKIILPSKEPFGKSLTNYIKNKYKKKSTDLSEFLYQELYDSTQTKARLAAEKNKFKIKGKYKSASSSEIYLNAMNVPRGSVKVTAGGIQLKENEQYTVDYSLGTVKILDKGLLESGQPIKVSLESQSMFNLQTKTLIGTHLDYRFSPNFNLGGTVLHLNERPLNTKVNIGDEPISNTIWGLNGSYKTNWQFLTTLVDKLPLIQTKEESTITLNGEFAQLIPGTSKAVGKNGIAYIDDFENSKTKIDVHLYTAWRLASTPQKNGLFQESNLINDLNFNKNRAKIAWYTIDQLFTTNDNLTPSHLYNTPQQKSHYVREVYENELFPNKQNPNNYIPKIQILNLAYYPDEKGHYNYDLNLNPDGKLRNPEDRWGGIMRKMQTNDFEAANVEFIEFWMLDPFVEDTTPNKGSLYFNLGNVSEDVLRDSRRSFENGLPSVTESNSLVDSTVWGLIPISSAQQPSFDPNVESRKKQDVGLDGLRNDEVLDKDQEYSYFSNYADSLSKIGLSNDAYQKLIKDISSDNFHYYRGSDYDREERSILDRYKDYNGLEQNTRTPEQSPESYTTQGVSYPDAEDINEDNTLNENESYFEYKIEIDPSEFVVGKNYITDIVTTSIKGNPKKARWIQFKVPLKSYQQSVGEIYDFKSIRFMRMFLTGFSSRVIMRFATLDLVRSEWRKYEGNLGQPGEGVSYQGEPSSFDIQAVNLEENSNRTPIPYVMPPGVEREKDPYSQSITLNNEQSMVLKVKELPDGESVAAFKTASIDMRQYKYLRMYIHGEELDNQILNNNDLSIFIRIGTDYKNNYYEYEIPLVVSALGSRSEKDIWPEENNMNLLLADLMELKQRRDDLGLSLQSVYQEVVDLDGDGPGKVFRRLTVTGTPTLSNIRTIMIGIKNPDGNNPNSNDGLPKSAEIWVNELRLTDFSDYGGWAANGRAQVKLADFSTISVAGSKTTPGFGSIEQKINERAKEETNQYDVSANTELGKFFPEKAQVKIPMYTSYSLTEVKPEYNPYNEDIPLDIALKALDKNKKEQESLEKRAEDQTIRRSLNFTNVKVNRYSKVPMPYDPGNFAFTYAYSDLDAHNPTIEYNKTKNYRLGANYLYNLRPKNVSPLTKIGFLNNPYLALIRDFNFYYLPSMITVNSDVNRSVRKTRLRNLNKDDVSYRPDPSIEENYTWVRNYDVKFNLSRALRFDFSSSVNDRITNDKDTLDDKEIKARIYDEESNFLKKNSFYHRLFENDNRKTVNYNHQLTLNYTIPINKLPFLHWISASASYKGTYDWQKGPDLILEESKKSNLGNNLNNSNNIGINGQANLSSIYSKSSLIRKATEKPTKTQFGPKQTKDEVYEIEVFSLKAGVSKSIYHRLGTDEIKVIVTDSEGKLVEGSYNVVSDDRASFTSNTDVNNVKIRVEGKVEIKDNIWKTVIRHTVNLATSVKNISVSYNIGGATSLSGYTHETEIVGGSNVGSRFAPGIPFLIGIQDTAFPRLAAQNWNYINADPNIVSPISMSKSTSINIRSTVQPMEDLRIDLTANHSLSGTSERYYKIENGKFDFNKYTNIASETGNMSMSVISFASFEKLSSDSNFRSHRFERMKIHRKEIRKRLEEERNDPNVRNGYSDTSQWVLIPAFLASYTTFGDDGAPLSYWPSFQKMRPNWRASYDGLTKIPIVAEYFSAMSLEHSYSASYNLGSFISASGYRDTINFDGLYEEDNFPDARYENGIYIPRYEIGSVSINEQFSPLIGIDMTFKNGLSTRFEYGISRSMNLTMANNQITDTKGKEYTVGVGYRISDVPLQFITSSSGQAIKSDLDLKANFTLNDEVTVLRRLEEGTNDINAGARNISMELTGDYALSEKLNLQMFYKQQIFNPYTTLQYGRSDIEVGFSLRFSLTQ